MGRNVSVSWEEVVMGSVNVSISIRLLGERGVLKGGGRIFS